MSKNISGSAKRAIHTSVKDSITAILSGYDSDTGDRLISNMPAFLVDVAQAAHKCSAPTPKLPSLFLDAVPTTLSDGSTITALTLARIWTFREGLTSALGISADTSVDTLAKALVAGGHTFTQAHIDEMKARTDLGEKTGIRKDGWGNFYPRENNTGSVSVGYVYHGNVRWRSYGSRLDDDGRWDAGSRLLIRNMDTSIL